jgi:hypothetical protein
MIIPLLQIITIGTLVGIKKMDDRANKKNKETINKFAEAIKEDEENIKITDQQIDDLRGTKSDLFDVEQQIDNLEAIKKLYEENIIYNEISKKYYERNVK